MKNTYYEIQKIRKGEGGNAENRRKKRTLR